MNLTQLTIILTLGIIAIKIFWISTEIRYFKNRLNFTMFKTNLIEALILFLQIYVAFYYPLPKTQFDNMLVWIGIAMYLSGIILALWARLTMNKVWGIPGEHSSQQKELTTTGPFAFSRNPIYLGFLLIYFGFSIAIRSWLIVLRIPLALYFYKSALKEEKLLEKKFGQKYLSYKSRVPLIF